MVRLFMNWSMDFLYIVRFCTFVFVWKVGLPDGFEFVDVFSAPLDVFPDVP